MPEIRITLPKRHRRVKTLSEVAAHLGMSPRTLTQWRSYGWISPGLDGRWNTRDISKVALLRNAQRARRLQPDEVDLRIKELKLASLEHDLAVRRASIISVEEVREQREAKIRVLESALYSMNKEIAPLLVNQDDPEKVRQVIDSAIRQRLRVFSGQECQS